MLIQSCAVHSRKAELCNAAELSTAELCSTAWPRFDRQQVLALQIGRANSLYRKLCLEAQLAAAVSLP